MLKQRVQQYGNSYGVIIPSAILKVLDIEKGDTLKLDISRKRIIFEKIGDVTDAKPKQERKARKRK